MKSGRPLTPGEVKMWLAGYLAALGEVEKSVGVRRIRIAARSIPITAPTHWPAVVKQMKGER